MYDSIESFTIWSVCSCLILVAVENKIEVTKIHVLAMHIITNCLLSSGIFLGLLLLSGQLDFRGRFLSLVLRQTIKNRRRKYSKDPTNWY